MRWMRSSPRNMVRAIRKNILAVALCTALVVSGCADHANPEPLIAIASPAIPLSVQEIPNPLRGQYEDLLLPLFPQSNPAQKRYPAWPASYDASLRIPWRQLQPTDPSTLPPDAPDDRKYDFSVIDDALTKLAARNMRMTLRVVAYSSCCDTVFPNNTNIGIPDWMRSAATDYPGPEKYWWTPGVTQVVPNWNDPKYLNAFGQLRCRTRSPLRRRRAAQCLGILRLRGFQRKSHRVFA